MFHMSVLLCIISLWNMLKNVVSSSKIEISENYNSKFKFSDPSNAQIYISNFKQFINYPFNFCVRWIWNGIRWDEWRIGAKEGKIRISNIIFEDGVCCCSVHCVHLYRNMVERIKSVSSDTFWHQVFFLLLGDIDAFKISRLVVRFRKHSERFEDVCVCIHKFLLSI